MILPKFYLFSRSISSDIYPAREKPINGVTSEVLLNKIEVSKKEIIKKIEINDVINKTCCKTIAILGEVT